MMLDDNRQKQRDRQMEKDNTLSNGKLIRTKLSVLTHLNENKPFIRDQIQRLFYPYNIVGKYFGEVQ